MRRVATTTRGIHAHGSLGAVSLRPRAAVPGLQPYGEQVTPAEAQDVINYLNDEFYGFR